MSINASSNDDEIISSSAFDYRRVSQRRLEDTRTRFFKSTLHENGVILSKNDHPHVLAKEQSLVIRDIEKSLAQNSEGDNAVQFFTGFTTCCKQNSFLHTSLLPTILKKGGISDDDSNINAVQQESLIRILLQVDSIQNEVLEFVLEEATKLLGEDNDEAPEFRLILNAMKYLPFINSADVVTQKILDMVEIGMFGAQLEILNSIPEIIPDSQYEKAAKQLSRILENNNEITSAVIDCLNSLNLSSNTRIEIQQYIMEWLLSSASIDVYPVLFDFLTCDCKPINLPVVLLKCRDALNDLMRNGTIDKEKESRKVIIMNKLQILAASKVQFEGWMNLLSNLTHFKTVHKPIDIIILAMLHSTGTNQKARIEGLIKKHVKTDSLKKQHLEMVFEKYFIKQILQDYFMSIIEIASSLLKNPIDQLSTEFASTIFILLFKNDNIDRVQRQDILHTLILLTSGWEVKNVSDILKILLELSKDEKLRHHIIQLMGLLEKVDMFELKDVKQVFELLCYMTCNNLDGNESGLRDELHMLIRKQISSSKRHLKQRGIIGAVVMAKHIATLTDEQDSNEETEDSLLEMSEDTQESVALLELARSATSSIPELMGLYYDQLASMLLRALHLDKGFMKWLQESVQDEFESTYTQKEVPRKINDIPIYPQFCLNEEGEIEESFSMNIAGLTMTPGLNNPITLLASMFRMFRMLCNKYVGNLEDIDALLGCGVVLPELEDISLYDKDQCKSVADSLFHCINWFRETISAFVRHTNKKIRLKLVDRIGHLIKLEKLLMKCLMEIPDHKLPSSYFYDALASVLKGSPIKTKSDTKISRARKKLKANTGEAIDLLNESTASVSTTFIGTQKRKPASKRTTAIQASKPEFRELDTDLIILLKYPLNLGDMAATISSPQIRIDIATFEYVISDIVSKLNLIVNNKNLGMSNLSDINPTDLVKDCAKFAPKVFGNFKQISKEIGKLLDEAEYQDDHQDLYTLDAKTLKNSFCLCLEYFMLLFSWKGFVKNLGLLRDCLKNLVDEETPSQSIMCFSRNVTNKFITTADQCLYLQPAVWLVKLLEALYNINTENTEIKKKITAVSGKFLNKKWYNNSGDLDSGKVMNVNLDILIKAYLDGANIKTISGIVGTLQKQVENVRSKDDHLEMLESINKNNFPVLYRSLCHFTLERVKTEVISLTNKEHLVLWKTTATIMQGLMQIAKSQDVKTNYINFLQKSNTILNVFLLNGIPILEIMLKSKPDEVVEILKTLQTSTRFLHHLCCTSKLTKDSSIMKHVPNFKRTLETLVYRVKAALVANDCSEAFWMGNLKNRDLDGDEILTQSCTTTDGESINEEVEEEEELPAEDSDDDELRREVEEASRNGQERSASEIYE
ncbi:hypothetical protein Trydic_g6650 [Trypoxylus dichotomus]